MAVLTGTNGNDTLTGTPGNDFINGLEGNDTIDAVTGRDIVDGGAGIDLLLVDYSSANSPKPMAGSFGSNGAGGYNGYFNDGIDQVNYSNIEKFSVIGTRLNDAISTGDNDDILSGGAGDDTLKGNGGNDSLSGGDGNDLLLGGAGNDTLNGGAGIDTIDGGEGVDTLVDADFSSATANLSFNDSGSTFADTTLPDGSSIKGIEYFINITSGSGNDDIRYTARQDNQFSTGAGNDTINPGLGNDTVDGGDGEDLLIVDYTSAGSPGNGIVSAIGPEEGSGKFSVNSGSAIDQVTFSHIERFNITGTSYSDSLLGGSGNDTLSGGSGDDTLNGGGGNDVLNGGAGNDTYVFTLDLPQGSDTITDLSGNNTLTFNSSTQAVFLDLTANTARQINANLTLTLTPGTVITTVNGGALGDFLIGGSNANVFNGGAGNDTLNGGGGNDTLNGGDGDDTYVFNTGSTALGNETIVDAVGSNTLAFNSALEGVTVNLGLTEAQTVNSSLTLTLTPGTLIAMVSGSGLNDTLIGDDSANKLAGSDGNDALKGNAGNDTLSGGNGNDTLDGGSGDDLLDGGSGDDLYLFHTDVNQGSDSITDALGSNTLTFDTTTQTVNLDLANADAQTVNSNLTLTLNTSTIANVNGGSLDDVILGNSANNTLNGGAGNDQLTGGAGNDTLVGGAGNDTLTGNAGSDTFTLTGSAFSTLGVDTITDFLSGTDRLVLNTGIFAALATVTNGTLPAADFAVINDAADGLTAAGSSAAAIVYNQATGDLYYNPDRDIAGLASGGLFAKLTGGVALANTDIVLQA